MARPKPNRSLALLHPRFRERVETLIGMLKVRGLPFRPHEFYRNAERQTWSARKGSSLAMWLQSQHNFGCAADFVGLGDEPWAASLPWDEYGAAVEEAGLSWAGRWRNFRELVHCDYANVRPMRDLRLGILVDDITNSDETAWLAWWWEQVADTSTGIAVLQRVLVRLGYAPGAVDGHWGPRTRTAAEEALERNDSLYDATAREELCGALAVALGAPGPSCEEVSNG